MSNNQIPNAMTRLGVLWNMLPKVLLYLSSTGSLMIGTAAQLVATVVVARNLGVEQFGQLMTITAATTVAAQLCGLGSGEAMIRRVARDHRLYSVVLGHNLVLILTSGMVLTTGLVALLHFFVHISNDPVENITIISVLAFSNIVVYRWIWLTEQIFLARSQFSRANIVNAGFAAARMLTAAAACIVFGVSRLETWVLWHGALHLAVAGMCVGAVWQYGAPQWSILRNEVKLGIHFTTPFFFLSLQQNIDILALNLVATPAIVGSYGVASRIVQASMLSVSSFNRIVYPRLVVAGEGGVRAVFPMAIKYSYYMVGVAAVSSIGLFVFAPWILWVFGKDFSGTAPIIRVICWTPIIAAITSAAYNALGATDKHFIRANAYNVCSFAGTVLIGVLTYVYGLNGTFIGLYVSQILLAVVVWATLISLNKSE